MNTDLTQIINITIVGIWGVQKYASVGGAVVKK